MIFVGHVISKHGIEVDPKKVEAVLKWEIPRNVPEDVIDDMLKDLEVEIIENLSYIERPVNIVNYKVK